MNRQLCLFICILIVHACNPPGGQEASMEVPESVLRDKILGGIIGQFFGNLNGLVHENRYTDEPGNVTEYIPDLSHGARTDDDTDIEFVYIYHMLEGGRLVMPYDTIYLLWKEHISDKIWCSNAYARNLMEIGIRPPYTGRVALNPWAGFNISGQFLCEQFGLISPGMPRTAARIGTHYTHVAVDGEPVQATQLFDAMIATAFFEDDLRKIIDAGLASVDPRSEIHGIVSNVLHWHGAYPDDWRNTRLAMKETYWNGTFGGAGGTNGYRITTAATIASLLYGEGDLVESLRHAFNFGWDADNVAAMAGTIAGLMKGARWIMEQGWDIKDIYTNDRRPGLPAEMTISDFAGMHLRLAERNILEHGGKVIRIEGEKGFLIRIEEPANIEALPDPLDRAEALREEWRPRVEEGLTGDSTEQMVSVYMAACLDLAGDLILEKKDQWQEALQVFEPHFEILFEEGMWSQEARQYFRDVASLPL